MAARVYVSVYIYMRCKWVVLLGQNRGTKGEYICMYIYIYKWVTLVRQLKATEHRVYIMGQ